MAKTVKIEIITRETIHPASPTPQHQKYIKLSLFDQLNFAMATPILLFYPPKTGKPTSREVISRQLKSSLSQALTLYYPIAGRIKDNSIIECNDDGVEFAQSRVNCTISDIFRKPDSNLLENLIQINLNPTGVLPGAVIQVNFFACGGFAIGFSLSHKIADGVSIHGFITAWAAASMADDTKHEPTQLRPHFVSNTIIPSLNESFVLPPPPPASSETTKCVTRRYVIDATKIPLLRTKAASKTVPHPTRIESVTGFIWKCLMNISILKSGYDRASVLIQAVELRKRFAPPLPDNYIGNLSGKFLAKTDNSTCATLPDLVSLFRQGLDRTSEEVARGVRANDVTTIILKFVKELTDLHKRDDVDFYSFAGYCKIPMYEAADFGWGKPAWVVPTNLVLKNYVVLMDARDGEGIEVWMSMSAEDLDLLDRNQELLAFFSVNPSVCNDTGGPVIKSCL